MLREHLRVRWTAPELDRRLAEGADPRGDPLLELRATRLVTPAARAALATGLESVVASVEEPKRPLTAAIPVRRQPVRGARHELMPWRATFAGRTLRTPAASPWPSA